MQMQPSKRGSMEEEDRLSSLPDDLLHSILRKLPLKHAVRTSVLSRRWAPQWLRALASSRVLDFTDPDLARGWQLPPQQPATVRHCLELQAQHGTPLDVLRVALWSPPEESSFGAFQRDVVGWIASAVARGAREVEVEVVVDEDNAAAFVGDVELPGDLLVARNSLARLALCGFSLRAAPTGLGLAGLRSLSLSHVDITGEVLRDVVSSCRALEHLRLSDSECELIRIAGETLRVLEIVRCTAVRKVRVTAPALESIAFHESKFLWTWPDRNWTGDDDEDLVFDFGDGMPALREVYLSRIRYDHDGNTTNYESLLEHVKHAPVWTISCEGYSLPLMFDSSNIQELQLRIPREDDEDSNGLQGCFTEFFDFLPLLDRLFVRLPGQVTEASDVDAAAALADVFLDDYGQVVDEPRVYELERLSFIKLVNFGGTRLELQLVAFLLKCAPALEHLVLVTVGEGGPGEVIQRHVSAMHKASPHARLTVCRPSQDSSQNPVHTRLYDQAPHLIQDGRGPQLVQEPPVDWWQDLVQVELTGVPSPYLVDAPADWWSELANTELLSQEVPQQEVASQHQQEEGVTPPVLSAGLSGTLQQPSPCVQAPLQEAEPTGASEGDASVQPAQLELPVPPAPSSPGVSTVVPPDSSVAPDTTAPPLPATTPPSTLRTPRPPSMSDVDDFVDSLLLPRAAVGGLTTSPAHLTDAGDVGAKAE